MIIFPEHGRSDGRVPAAGELTPLRLGGRHDQDRAAHDQRRGYS